MQVAHRDGCGHTDDVMTTTSAAIVTQAPKTLRVASRVYVDSAIHSWRGQKWCHVFSPDFDALHRMLASVGSRREWFQDPSTMKGVSWPHYDANAGRRAALVQAGAVPLGRHQTVVMAGVIRNRWFGTDEDPLAGHRRRGSPLTERLEEWLGRELGE